MNYPVHALYHDHYLIPRIVNVFFLLETFCMIVGFALSVHDFKYDEMCFILSIPSALCIYGWVDFCENYVEKSLISIFFQARDGDFPGRCFWVYFVQVHPVCVGWFAYSATYGTTDTRWDLGILVAIL